MVNGVSACREKGHAPVLCLDRLPLRFLMGLFLSWPIGHPQGPVIRYSRQTGLEEAILSPGVSTHLVPVTR